MTNEARSLNVEDISIPVSAIQLMDEISMLPKKIHLLSGPFQHKGKLNLYDQVLAWVTGIHQLMNSRSNSFIKNWYDFKLSNGSILKIKITSIDELEYSFCEP